MYSPEVPLPIKKLAKNLTKQLLTLNKIHRSKSSSFKITKEIVRTCPFDFNFAKYNAKDIEQRWQFIKDLRDATNQEWQRRMQTGDINYVAELATWVVEKTGGIRSNKEETMLRYTEKAAAYGFVDKHDGISSYSKVLSGMNRHDYQIFDTRVAACLNILQLNFFGGRRYYFDVGGARNSDVKAFTTAYKKKDFFEIEYRLPKKSLKMHDYKLYNLLVGKMAHYAREEPLDIEMMLFDYVLPLVKDLSKIEEKFEKNRLWAAQRSAYWRARGKIKKY